MKKTIIALLFSFLLFGFYNQTVYCYDVKSKIKIVNTSAVTYTQDDADRLSTELVKTIITDNEIKGYLQEISKNMNTEITLYQIKDKMIKFHTITDEKTKNETKQFSKQLEDGYYVYVYYKESKKSKIIRLTLFIGKNVLNEFSPTSTVGNVLHTFLSDVFGVSKIKQIKKFNETYEKIRNRMDILVMQEFLQDIQQNPESYGMKPVIRNSTIHLTPQNIKYFDFEDCHVIIE